MIQFEVTTSQEGLVALEGCVTLQTVPAIRRTMLRIASGRNVRNLRVDFSRVTQVDTSAIAMLIETWRTVTRKGGALHLQGTDERCRRLMRLARVDQLFVVENPADAG
jgi:anti-anti-sigma factor